MNNFDFDKRFENTVKVVIILTTISVLASSALIATAIYLLVKNFG